VAVLGRSHGNAVRIPSAEVSRQHCRLLMKDGLVRLEDLDSVNGTFLNGKRVRDPEFVRPGDSLEVGPVKFVVEYELTPDALERLRGEGGDTDLLEALADGEVVPPDEMEMLEAEMMEEEIVDVAADPEEATTADFDFDAGPWQMPEGGNLRDILSQLEDEPEKPTRHRSKKRP
jgi:pSer/pThr/pTyr-binding forkhead associated (FHA) protein